MRKLLNPECNCTDQDKCPFGRPTTIPRCTIDDLIAFLDKRDRVRSQQIRDELEEISRFIEARKQQQTKSSSSDQISE